MGEEEGARLCELMTRAHLAGVPTSRTLWSHVANALDASCDHQPPYHLASQLLAASVGHPLASALPRDPVHSWEVVHWLRDQWSARGWDIPTEFTTCAGAPSPDEPPELFYKTYVGWGGGGVGNVGVTLLESGGGIVHNTTGLTTWYGAAILAGWAVDNSAILAGRRVLELGAGVGFTASVILTTPDTDHPPPLTYTVTDCHHHVLTLLHHNLALNLAPSPPQRDQLEKFQRETSLEVALGEVEAGQVVTWRPPSTSALTLTAAAPAAAVVPGAGVTTEVCVMQVDWRHPPRLPPADLLLAADVVYARHLIPPLVALIRSILDGSASRQDKGKRQQTSKMKGHSRERGAVVQEDEAPGHGEKFREKETTSKDDDTAGNDEGGTRGGDGVEREAFIACTRRSQETVGVFLEEVSRQGLQHKLVYQATLDTHTALFLYNETHLPVKIYRITLLQEPSDRGNGRRHS
ncbi:uncharacterized protein [Panulirus ornatus]|uniref:uncharacterized protein n=1 Tax=Panulirus ornatus TaxID=150431 RepID=UPI003A83AE02